ncbi:hypothetical protein LCGC14_2559250 [marine sediment metagenome]|uniref:Uncharacterized protein n=1 Tax=marine sediment metagenome TaxID=412755 RepID=A0A0F9B8E7_9ZZZZ
MVIGLIGFLVVIQIACIGFLTFAARERHVKAIRYRRQRDCLYKYFNIYAEKFFLFEPLPQKSWKVLNEIESK